jgi:HAD superfamily phosphatase (TIGR01668 family)
MPFLLPTIAVNGIKDITLEILDKLKVKAIFLDVDNTLAIHDSQVPFEGAVEWTKKIRMHGYKVLIVSNNFNKRVKPFASKFETPYLAFAKKPFPVAFSKAKKLLKDDGLRPEDCLVVGDQIFTDILGANLCQMKSILLEPVGKEKSTLFRMRRRLENRIRRKIREGERKSG